METVRLEFKRLSEHAQLPRYQTDLAAGMDLHAALESSVELPPGQIHLVPCGFSMSLPPGFEAQVRPRSGLASRHGVTLPNAPGTIDADYRGEVMVPLINLGQEPFQVEPGMRVAQMVVMPVLRAEIVEVEDLAATGRGSGGFGSTGR